MGTHDLLRTARLARGVSLEHVIAETRMSPRIVHALDEGRFADLPAGIYARSYVRTFAAVVGLDRSAVDEVMRLLPDAADPLPTIRDIVVEKEMIKSRARKRAFKTGAAAVIDAVALLALGGTALESVARIAGTTGAAMVNASGIPLALVFVALAAIYFLMLAGISGTTIGTHLCGIELLAREPKLDLAAIGTRAWRVLSIEVSLVATIGRRLRGPTPAMQPPIGRLTFDCATVDRRFPFESAIGQSPIAVHSTTDD